jgi:hypothetical protein
MSSDAFIHNQESDVAVTSVPPEGYLPLRLLASKYGYAKDHLGRLARAGQIEAARHGIQGQWFASEGSFDRYRELTAAKRQQAQLVASGAEQLS